MSFYGTYGKGDYVEEILDNIALANDLIVEKHGRDWEDLLTLADYAPDGRRYGPIHPPSENV